MVSSTKQTERRRAMNARRLGRLKKKMTARASTPAFPIQPEGYDPKAADAKKPRA